MKKIALRIIKSIIAILLACGTCVGQSLVTLNPGITIGHTFGDHGGLTLGVELSLVASKDLDNSSLYALGAVASYNYCFGGDRHMLHLGAEVSSGIPLGIGLDVGPTYVVGRRDQGFGVSATAYAFAVTIPYLDVTYLPGMNVTLTQLGMAGKLPIPLRGSLPNMFGTM
jgi:hypothetical protein